MQHSKDQETFLSMIKSQVIKSSVNAKITPSVMAALAISISSWNTDPVSALHRNIYKYPVSSNWKGKCYSVDSMKVYESKEECEEVGAILYRVYDTYNKGINEWISGLVSKKRSENGPLKYEIIIGCRDYKETIDRLVRCGFMQEYLNKVDDIEYTQNLIYLIEEYKLYKWDEELKNALEEENMSKKKKKVNIVGLDGSQTEEFVEVEEDDEVEEEATQEEEVQMDIYRVRESWEKAGTQVFSSPDFEAAKEEALKHKGYKVYINDDGELYYDPWVAEEVDNSGKAVDIIVPTVGREVIFAKEPVYLNALSTPVYKYATGTFYFYDSDIINGRVKISVTKEGAIKRDRSKVLGWVKVR